MTAIELLTILRIALVALSICGWDSVGLAAYSSLPWSFSLQGTIHVLYLISQHNNADRDKLTKYCETWLRTSEQHIAELHIFYSKCVMNLQLSKSAQITPVYI